MITILRPQFFDAQFSKEQIINLRKTLQSIKITAQEKAKHTRCLICGKEVSSFCKSHSIPKMSLKKIATEGKLSNIFAFAETEVFNREDGLANAGTFFIICNDCDNSRFQKYENPQSYLTDPARDYELINQIALKNILSAIYKHEVEAEMISLMQQDEPSTDYLFTQQFHMKEIEIQECYNAFNKCQHSTKSRTPWLNVIISENLNYIAPIAYQGMIPVITGFDGEIINNKYITDPEYQIEYIHFAVLPINNQTIILAFMDKDNMRYDRFIKRVNALSKTKKVQLISYMLFLYCEEYYYSKQITQRIPIQVKKIATSLEDPFFVNPQESLKRAIEDYSLRKAWTFPNVLGIHVEGYL